MYDQIHIDLPKVGDTIDVEGQQLKVAKVSPMGSVYAEMPEGYEPGISFGYAEDGKTVIKHVQTMISLEQQSMADGSFKWFFFRGY